MGQIDIPPIAIIECDGPRSQETSRFLEIAAPTAAESKVFRGVVGIPEVKAPAEVEQEPLASRARLWRLAGVAGGKRTRFFLGSVDGGCADRTHFLGCYRYGRRQQASL
jgi:hypothetical protein